MLPVAAMVLAVNSVSGSLTGFDDLHTDAERAGDYAANFGIILWTNRRVFRRLFTANLVPAVQGESDRAPDSGISS